MASHKLKAPTRPENPTRYNYHELDKLLHEIITPESLGDHMDEIMHDLVCYVVSDEDYQDKQLEWRYTLLRTLRDLFWKLENTKP